MSDPAGNLLAVNLSGWGRCAVLAQRGRSVPVQARRNPGELPIFARWTGPSGWRGPCIGQLRVCSNFEWKTRWNS